MQLSRQLLFYIQNWLHHHTINPSPDLQNQKAMFLYIRNHEYKFKKEIMKVHWFSPDNQDGVVILGLRSLGKDAIYHYNADSKLVFQHCFEELIDSCAILDPKQVIALQVKYNRIFILNLETHQVRYYKFHYFQIEVSCQVKLETFIQTSLVCIRQNGDCNDHRLKLTYYRYPFSEGNIKDPNQLVCTFQSTQNYQWNVQYSLRKGNNHSMILWHKSRQDQVFELRIFDLKDKQLKTGRVQGNYRVLRIKNSFQFQNKPIKLAVCLMKVWQMSHNVFMLICTTDKETRNMCNKNGNFINNFVWDVDKQIIRDSRVQFENKFNPYQIEMMSSGKYAMFRTFYFENNGEEAQSPALFIRNSNENIVEYQWVQGFSRSKWRVVDYSDSIFVQGIYDNSQVTEIYMRTVRILCRPMQSFNMLMQGGDDLDEQLLCEIMSYLDYDSQEEEEEEEEDEEEEGEEEKEEN